MVCKAHTSSVGGTSGSDLMPRAESGAHRLFASNRVADGCAVLAVDLSFLITLLLHNGRRLRFRGLCRVYHFPHGLYRLLEQRGHRRGSGMSES